MFSIPFVYVMLLSTWFLKAMASPITTYPTTSSTATGSSSSTPSISTTPSLFTLGGVHTFIPNSNLNIDDLGPTALLGQLGSAGVMVINVVESLLPLELTVSCSNCIYDQSIGYYSDNSLVATAPISQPTDILSYSIEKSTGDGDGSIQVQFYFTPKDSDSVTDLHDYTASIAATVWPHNDVSGSQLGWIWWPSLSFRDLFDSNFNLGILDNEEGSLSSSSSELTSTSEVSTVIASIKTTLSRPLINVGFSAQPQETFSELSFSAIGTELTYFPESVFLLAGSSGEQALTYVYPDTLIIDPEGRFHYHAIITNTDYSTFEFTAIANSQPTTDYSATVFISASYAIGLTNAVNSIINLRKRAGGDQTLQLGGSYTTSSVLSQHSTVTIHSTNIPQPISSYTVVPQTFPTFTGYSNGSTSTRYGNAVTTIGYTTYSDKETTWTEYGEVDEFGSTIAEFTSPPSSSSGESIPLNAVITTPQSSKSSQTIVIVTTESNGNVKTLSSEIGIGGTTSGDYTEAGQNTESISGGVAISTATSGSDLIIAVVSTLENGKSETNYVTSALSQGNAISTATSGYDLIIAVVSTLENGKSETNYVTSALSQGNAISTATSGSDLIIAVVSTLENGKSETNYVTSALSQGNAISTATSGSDLIIAVVSTLENGKSETNYVTSALSQGNAKSISIRESSSAVLTTHSDGSIETISYQIKTLPSSTTEDQITAYTVYAITTDSQGLTNTITSDIPAGALYTGTLIGSRININNGAISTYTYAVASGVVTLTDQNGKTTTQAVSIPLSVSLPHSAESSVAEASTLEGSASRGVNSGLQNLWIYVFAFVFGFIVLI